METASKSKLVGKSVKRSEDPRLLTGHGCYTDDKQVANLLHIAFRRSDQSHARIVGIDYAAALELPGVVAIFTAEHMDSMVKPIYATSKMPDYHPTAIYPLARGKVRYVGEPVVAVVAESRYIAEDAMDYIQIDYELLPNVVDPEAAAEPDAPLLHEEAGTNILVKREFRRGDIDEVMAQAPIKVGARFRFHRKTPLAMENRTYLAEYDQGRRSLLLHSSTGSPGIVRDALVDILGIPGSRLRVVAPDVGGSFGGKGSLYPEEILVCALARHLGRPVKWTGDRMEDLAATSQAFDETVYAELAVDEQGAILGLRANVIGDVGAYSIYPWTAGLEPVQVISFMPGPYRVPVYHGKVRGVATSKSPTGPYRGVGRPTSTFVMERLVDMAAHKLGLDTKEIRLRNLIKPEEFPYKTAPGIVWDRSGFIECLESGCEAVDYDTLRQKQEEARAAGRWVGIGISSYAELSGIGSRISASPGMPINTGTEICNLKIDPSGSITASFGIASHGQGLETTLAQVVADELGARFEEITVIHGDTAAVSHSTGTYASRSAVLAGGAGTLAARALREKLERIAAHLMGSHAPHISISEGVATAADNGKSLTIAEIADAVYSQMGRVPKDVIEVLEETKSYDPVWGTTSSSTHIAMVEIDPETYMIHVTDYLVAEDCGRMINPLIVDGQAHGAVAQGIGAALFEEIVYDERGQILTASLVDYVAPSAPEVPATRVVHVESALPDTIGGFRGMGEGGTIGAPAAIANAVSDALTPLGIEIFELPVTPERLFQLIQKQKLNTKEM
ncbi:xanthine dehydrogenase family protein molybdopterin-binding subunit [Noviherbaspirillum sedimenti]|uniref:Xanthine dehydrogenase family protein molybdopterin-binding subunit n=1 Tax=Noviherbaspirillum sedimenti TaxID=2320865 RepID=A0A3A3GGL9_9BURK|nr:xanthine dehydrogenase family protein molybdopterin-binding subunit [Noviherbaspirillum sedimenti]RJG01416.1 xanthine dehydrogenase family protein molybdopterin-binding subunit [Noviherbaspirillum sedimenti]